MRTYTAATTTIAGPQVVLDVLTDRDACRRWAPVAFDVERLLEPRLAPGSRARVCGRLAGRSVGFDVEAHWADAEGLALSADGPVALDVACAMRPAPDGNEVHATIDVRPRGGLRSRVLAEATAAVPAAGRCRSALGRIAREAVPA
jgi:hypothetical protein